MPCAERFFVVYIKQIRCNCYIKSKENRYEKRQHHDYNDRFLCIGTCKVNVKTSEGEETIETKVKVAGMIEKRSDIAEPYYVFLSNIIFEQ